MIRIQPSWVEGVRAADSPRDLHRSLQAAIELEHATIPLYLTAYFSLKPGTNDEVGRLLRAVVIEEMLHLCVAANVLNAVGGRPVLDKPEFVPCFPGSLPMGIDGDLVLHLAPMSLAQCEAFMDIEEPDDPLRLRAVDAAAGFETIGAFYEAIIDKLRELGEPAFGAPSSQQVTASWFRPAELFPVTDVASAVAGLELVVHQGEGTATSPVDVEGDPAHYYRFSEIKHTKRLVVDPAAPGGFSYTGDDLRFDAAQVWPLVVDPTPERYPAGSAARRLVDEFDRSYTRLLRALHETFNGQPRQLDAAIGLMYELRLLALQMVAEPDPVDPSRRVAPTWRYLDPTA